MDFVIKDSGKRESYDSGMVRDTQDGKPRFDLVDLAMLERWASHMTKGAGKYGEENWRLASSLEEARRFRASAFRHMVQWMRGDKDEDHAAAVFFNIAAYEYVMEKVNNGSNVQTVWSWSVSETTPTSSVQSSEAVA